MQLVTISLLLFECDGNRSCLQKSWSYNVPSIQPPSANYSHITNCLKLEKYKVDRALFREFENLYYKLKVYFC